ncbi:MAG: hypothetical protein MUF12_01555 [Sediminibacterium sp.]|jgi:uncharacterized protein YxeA|nr:hypothetical protein [Sediminibacterium sp.]
MKKVLSLAVVALLVTGAAFAHGDKKSCDKGKDCCKKEASNGKKDKDSCCKKDSKKESKKKTNSSTKA